MQIDNAMLMEQFILLKSNLLIQIVILGAIIDILLGMLTGLKCRELNSTKGLQGVFRHMGVITTILIVYPYMSLLHLNSYANWFVGFYIANYAISILENLTKLGAPVPSFLVKYLAKVKSTLDKGKG